MLEAIRGFVDWATGFGDSSLNFVSRTPAEGTYESPTVRSLWDFSRALVNLALAAIVMWGGFNIMVKEHIRSPYREVMELLPRLILAPLAANLTLESSPVLSHAASYHFVPIGSPLSQPIPSHAELPARCREEVSRGRPQGHSQNFCRQFGGKYELWSST